MTEKVWAINEKTKLKELVPAHWLKHPVLGKDLREVNNGKPVLRLNEPVIDKAPLGTDVARERLGFSDVVDSHKPAESDQPDETPKPTRRNKKED